MLNTTHCSSSQSISKLLVLHHSLSVQQPAKVPCHLTFSPHSSHSLALVSSRNSALVVSLAASHSSIQPQVSIMLQHREHKQRLLLQLMLSTARTLCG